MRAMVAQLKSESEDLQQVKRLTSFLHSTDDIFK